MLLEILFSDVHNWKEPRYACYNCKVKTKFCPTTIGTRQENKHPTQAIKKSIASKEIPLPSITRRVIPDKTKKKTTCLKSLIHSEITAQPENDLRQQANNQQLSSSQEKILLKTCFHLGNW